MKPKSIMLIAGEASGDMLAAELAKALRTETPSSLIFFGAGGPKMVEAGVEVSVDMTAHSVIGLVEALKSYSHFKRIFNQLLALAAERKPDVIVCVDFSGFNRRFAHAVREHIRRNRQTIGDWNPRIVQYVSPQVWASRPSRAEKMARDIDLLLCIFPFEKDWYAKRVPNLSVEFVGHPIVDRYAGFARDELRITPELPDGSSIANRKPQILLLPGSRVGELKRHLPVMLEAARQISAEHDVDLKMILPDEKLRQLADKMSALHTNVNTQVGGLAEALSQATLAIASTGTVTMECAYFGVPTIAIYKTSWSTYHIAKRIIQVKFLAMPNLLANQAIFPELIQDDATAEHIARAALALLENPDQRDNVRRKLAKVVDSLGAPGASERAARAILQLS